MKLQCSMASVETLDALRELVNIGVGRAACSISELCSREVGINVPKLEFCDFDEPAQLLDLQRGSTLRVSQGFSGVLAGHALLVLNEHGARRMAGLLLGSDFSPDALHENEQAALLELGNIIMGGVIGNLADQLGHAVNYELPQLQLRGIDGFVDLISDLVEPRTSRVLLMQASLSIAAENISGYLVLLFTRDQLAEMLSRLEASIRS
jgi:chemotaxis protein CheC